ncbi:hypothetical protein [Hahella ganghwensis]|uniref:hypothetical protein n=1 Tax=Hahella ganghwensis TaxID=286420 RepID=UPI000367B124|nr:hypothetical protein [Hahella ganghwensis]
MSISYGWEKLHSAIHSLCGQGEQAERLLNSVVFSLIQITPENDLPEEMRQEFQQFMDDMTSVEAQRDEGRVKATIDTLDEIEIGNKIEKVISFYDSICRHCEPF